MQTEATVTSARGASDDNSSERVDAELHSLCVEGWQLHRKLASMQAALKERDAHRPVLPAGMQAQPFVPRELAAPFLPTGSWHHLLVTPGYAFECSKAERVEQLQYGELQQGLQRQLKRTTEDQLRLQRLAQHTSQLHYNFAS